MPDFTVTVSGDQMNDVRDALGTDGQKASIVEVEAWILRQLQARVLQYEDRVEEDVKQNTFRGRMRGKGWNV